MLIIIPVLCFAFFLVTYAAVSNELGALTRWRMSFLSAAVTWGVAVTASTEVLSLFRLITFSWIVTFWIGLFLVSGVICWVVIKREKLLSLFQFPHIPWFELCCLGGVVGIVVIVGVVAFVAPPNNVHAIFYHMPRVMHWIQNQTVAHYPTNILFQLFYPPWAEFAIMHLQLLNGGDQSSNLVQWFSMLGSVIGVSLIAKQLGADKRGQALATVIAATIPMGIVQASSTQNDYVTAFWLVNLMYYVLQFRIQPGWANSLGVAASLGLALMTKATAYLYAVPLLVWFTFSALMNLRWKAWQPLLLIGAIVLSINVGHYVRNFDLWGNPFGIDQENPHPNRVFGVAAVTSNVIRHISLHIGTPSLDLNEAIRERIQSIHVRMGIDVDDPRTTLVGEFSQNWFSTGDNRAGNPIHLMMILASLALVFASPQRRRARDLLAYAVVLISAVLIFCSFLKWEVWQVRYHLPLFVLWSPFISSVLLTKPDHIVASLVAIILIVGLILYIHIYAIAIIIALLVVSLAFKWQTWSRPNNVITFLVTVCLMGAATLYLLRNQSRPLIGSTDSRTILNTNRVDQFFIYYPYRNVREVYFNALRFINSRNCREVGLMTGSWGREYLFWILLRGISDAKIRLEHVNVTNISSTKSKVQPFVDFSPCAIIVVDTDDYTPPKPDSLYTKGWSSGPVPNTGSENVTVFVKLEGL